MDYPERIIIIFFGASILICSETNTANRKVVGSIPDEVIF
jgi:hypothetical protein